MDVGVIESFFINHIDGTLHREYFRLIFSLKLCYAMALLLHLFIMAAENHMHFYSTNIAKTY